MDFVHRGTDVSAMIQLKDEICMELGA